MSRARLNVQGLSRKSPLLMKALQCRPNHTIVSIDLSAGEPTVTAHYSRDKNYLWATFDGVGQLPKYEEGILKIDDVYFMTMSVSPMGKDYLADIFHTKQFNGLPFPEAWLVNPEVVRTELKKPRQQHKILALGIGYGMGPKKMVRSAYDAGFELSFKDAEKFHSAYWHQLFPGLKSLSDRLAREVEKKGYIINPFGYRLLPDPHRAFNYFIQSSVSGIMHVFGIKLFAIAPYAKFITCIHDEFLVEVPLDKLEQFKHDKDKATDSLNDDLKWSVKIRTGFITGQDWYTAK